MENQLEKKYGLFTAIAMVVGIVIGSGIFFKTETVLAKANGNVTTGLLSIIIVGCIMIICSYAFSLLATKYEKVNGIVDYAEVAMGPRYAYYIGWFLTTVYYPCLTGVLAWVSARYTCVLFAMENPVTSGECLAIAAFYLCAIYAMNALSPKLAGKFQVSTTIIKLIPLLLMAVVGTIAGLSNGNLAANFSAVSTVSGETMGAGGALLAGCVSMAFSYEGWIIATAINAELKNAKRNLPIALILGSLIVVGVYGCYYLGIIGSINVADLMEFGSAQAFINTFGKTFGTLLTVFIVISCLGTCNGLMLASVRGLYAIASRGRGPKPVLFSHIDPGSNMPSNSAVIGLLLSAFWMMYFFGANLSTGWFGRFSFDNSELPIVTLYAMYIPIFVMLMKKEKEFSAFKRFGVPVLAICCCGFMVFAAFYAYGVTVLYYLCVFAVIMLIGAVFSKEQKA